MVRLATPPAVMVIISLGSVAFTEPVVRIPQDPQPYAVQSVASHDALVSRALSKSRAAHSLDEASAELRELKSVAESASGDAKGFLHSRLAYCKYYGKDDIGAEVGFRDIVNKIVPASPAVRADAQLRLGYLARKRNEWDKAYNEFSRLASGEVPSDAFTATDAAMRMAFIAAHRKNIDDALSILKQVAEQSPLKDDSDYARLMMANYNWEIGKKDYKPGLSEDERRQHFLRSTEICDQLAEDSTVRPEIRCIAELIRLENHHFLGDEEHSRNLALEFIAKWTPSLSANNPEVVKGKTFTIEKWPKRHLLTAQTWLLITSYLTGRPEEAVTAADKILGGYEADDAFKNFNCRGYALIYKALSLEALGDADGARRAREQCASEMPSWYKVTGASAETIAREKAGQ